MRTITLLSLVATYLCGATSCLAAPAPDKPITVRVASYNVEFGKSATPEQIGEMFKPYKLDMIGFDEAPDGDWTARVGKVLGMGYSCVGKISSANHKDKYKSILSRTPLEATAEHELRAGRGWNPASVVRAVTRIDGVSIAFYSLHICKSGAKDGHAYSLATQVLSKETTERVIVVGDFNNKIGDPAMNTIAGAGFTATWKDLQIDVSKAYTYNAQDPQKNLGVIDHILYNSSAGAKATDGGIIELEKPLSDHKPIWAQIAFPTSLESVRVMSYNIHRGGTVLQKQPLSQTAKVIREAKADIVGIQEPRSPKGFTTEKLASLLGWNHSADIRKGIILTPYAIVETLDGGIKVKLPTGQEAYVFSLHLPSSPYQPYQLLNIQPIWHKHKDTPFLKTEAEAIEAAKKARGGEISALLKQISELPDREAPVFVVGDFNEPSHLDWTAAAAKAGRHPIKVAYPTSSAMAKAGFADAFRTVYPDEMAKPGFTWTPIMKADDPKDHHDRIDFVYFKGNGVNVTDAKIVGENEENAGIVVAPYPSDHRAVVATFTLPDSPNPPKSPDEPGARLPARFGLDVTTYAPGSDPVRFKTSTHIAFGPGKQIVSDLKNNRFLFRNSPGDPFQVSPVSLKGQHSVVYNPADQLYYANDTDNHRIISFADLSSETITAQTKNIAGVALKRPHDIVLDPATGWIYAINPQSGHVFRFTAIGENESAIAVPLQGYARALTFTNGKLYAIGSAKGRIVEVVDWDTPTFKIYDSFDPTGKHGPAGSWTKTGVVLNDAEFFDGFWYATSYFTKSYASGSDFDKNKFIRFKTLDDLVTGNWTDLSSLVPSGMVPYYLTVNKGKLYLAIFNHESPGSGDSILQFALLNPPSSPAKNEKQNKGLKETR